VKAILFSILAVAMIGLMVPSAFAADDDYVKVIITPVEGSGDPTSDCYNRADLTMLSSCYSPAHVIVGVDDEIVFANTDTMPHSFTSLVGEVTDEGNVPVFDSGLLMRQDAQYTWYPDRPGDYPYYCVIHPWMTGLIVVEKAAEGGGCLIATAAFGSEMEPQVQFLRELRDNTVLQTQAGTSFMTAFNQFYYSFSPAVADLERENPAFKEAVKVGLTPLLTSLTLLNYVDIDTESEMLGYGIGVILLNVGMYFVAPAAVIIALKNRIKVRN
jgi:plastocyanin